MIRIGMWGDFFKDVGTSVQFERNFDVVRVLVHVDEPISGAVAEFFTTDNDREFRLSEIQNYCVLHKKKIWWCLDWHHGNGRETTQSPVRSGRYHRGITEGNVKQAIDVLTSWADPSVTFAIQLGNEQKVPDAWYLDVLRHLNRMMYARDFHDALVIAGGSESNMMIAMQENLADAVDLHLLRTDWRDRLTWARDRGYGIFASECSPPLDVSNKTYRLNEWRHMLKVLKDIPSVKGVGTFIGNNLDYPTESVTWNFKKLHNFLLFNNMGLTDEGQIWFEEMEKEEDQDMAITTEQVNERLRVLNAELARVQARINTGDGNLPRLRGRRDELVDQIVWLEQFDGENI